MRSALVLEVLHHSPAGLRAFPTRFGAVGHVLIVLEHLACGRALVAALRTAFAGRDRKHAVASGQFGRERTTVGTVDARIHRLRVFLIPLREEVGAVVKAHVALELAVGAGLGATGEMLAMRMGGLGTHHGRVQGSKSGSRAEDDR